MKMYNFPSVLVRHIFYVTHYCSFSKFLFWEEARKFPIFGRPEGFRCLWSSWSLSLQNFSLFLLYYFLHPPLTFGAYPLLLLSCIVSLDYAYHPLPPFSSSLPMSLASALRVYVPTPLRPFLRGISSLASLTSSSWNKNSRCYAESWWKSTALILSTPTMPLSRFSWPWRDRNTQQSSFRGNRSDGKKTIRRLTEEETVTSRALSLSLLSKGCNTSGSSHLLRRLVHRSIPCGGHYAVWETSPFLMKDSDHIASMGRRQLAFGANLWLIKPDPVTYYT